MYTQSPLLTELIDALCCLPGVGKKSAQRMAFELLQRQREAGAKLAATLDRAIVEIGHCTRCRNLSEASICSLCNKQTRDDSTLCVVESPADVLAIEQTSTFRGRYFVLMGRLSPLDGIGPKDLGLDLLAERLAESGLQEVIIATSSTVEGQATAHYIADLAQKNSLSATRIAHGVPLGGELGFVDGNTLAQAITARNLVT